MDSLTVQYTSQKNCFISLPSSYSNSGQFGKSKQGNAVYEVSYGDRTLYFSCFQLHDKNDLTMKINGFFSCGLSLPSNAEVSVKEYKQMLHVAKQVHVEAISEDDLEIAEINADVICSGLLNQLGVVWKDQMFLFWVPNSGCSCFLKVVCFTPENEVVRLEERTEVILNLCVSKPKLNTSMASASASNRRFSRCKSYSDTATGHLAHELPNHLNISKQGSLPSIPATTVGNVNPYFKGFFNDSLWNVFRAYVSPLPSPVESRSTMAARPAKLKPINYDDLPSDQIKRVLRVITVDEKLKSKYSTRSKCFNYVYVHADAVKPFHGFSFIATIKKIPCRKDRIAAYIQENKKSKNEVKKPDEISAKLEALPVVVRVIVLRDWNYLPIENFIMCSTALRQQLRLALTSNVLLTSVSVGPIHVDRICLYAVKSLKIDTKSVIASFNASIIDSNLNKTPQLLSRGSVVQLRINEDEKRCNFVCDIESKAQSKPLYSYLTLEADYDIDVKSMNLAPNQLKFPRKSLPDLEPSGLHLLALGGIESYKNECLQFLHLALSIGPLSTLLNDPKLSHGNLIEEYGGLLITGAQSCGKTALAQGLLKKLYGYQECIYSSVLECKNLQGKRPDVIKAVWENLLAEAIEHQPSVLFFDDLDFIIPEPSYEQVLRGETNSITRMAQLFIKVMTQELPVGVKIAIMASCQSKSSINQLLVTSKHSFLFRTVVEITPLEPWKRLEVLESLLLNKSKISMESLQALNMDWMTNKMQGYTAGDINIVVDRALHFAALRMSTCQQLMLTDMDFEKAFQDFFPSSYSEIEFSQCGSKSLQQVGGLSEVKSALKKILLWPTMYPKLFAQCPLKFKSGMLLYGPPGTGKTLIAGAVANECNLRFKSIKGPELLSRYIGASEQAVRDLFQNAEAAKPCLLFFDEFDAIAPKRGHDSTGVTDRVVNQFLTQLDGVESFEGVYILVATSRPDLIDAALLRPGRIDKHLFCPLPSKDERVEILEVLSATVELDEHINLEEIAEKTENYSGADIQAVLGTAFINAIHDKQFYIEQDEVDMPKAAESFVYYENAQSGQKILDEQQKNAILEEMETLKRKYSLASVRKSSLKCERGNSSPKISYQNICDALDSSKPSVSPNERLKYQLIYEKFSKKKSTSDTPRLNADPKRASLA